MEESHASPSSGTPPISKEQTVMEESHGYTNRTRYLQVGHLRLVKSKPSWKKATRHLQVGHLQLVTERANHHGRKPRVTFKWDTSN